MKLSLLLCLALLSPQMAASRRHTGAVRKRSRDLLPVTTAAPREKDFTFDLYRTLAASAPDQNIFFSPLSISMTLAMLSLGTGSNSRVQILDALGLHLQESGDEERLHATFQKILQELSQPQDSLQLSLGNALFVGNQVVIQQTFLDAMRTLYLADTFATNFEDKEGAKKQINDYVAKQTKNKILELVASLDGSEVMVMVNYIYFKAKWESRFNIKNTRMRDFHVSPDLSVQVPMMRNEDHYRYLQDPYLSCKVVGVPYQGNATALFILPTEGRMEQVESELNEKTIKKWLRMFTKRQLSLSLPKFSLETSYKLEKILPSMGIRDVFTSLANLSGISNSSNIHVSEMVHKAVVEVDESGTEAAAVTGTFFMFRSAQSFIPLKVVFNRPFLMAIVADSGNILFLGKVNKP